LQPEYIDNQEADIVEVDKERDRAIEMIQDCTSIDELIALEKQLGYGYEVEIKEKASTFKI
jgi:hypothetical protein